VELSLAALLLFWGFEAKRGEFKRRFLELRKDPLVIAVCAFVFVFLLASVFAYEATAAFWSNYERGEGDSKCSTISHSSRFSYCCSVRNVTGRRHSGVSLVAAGLMILYGIAGNFLLPGFIGAYANGALPRRVVANDRWNLAHSCRWPF